MKTAKSGHYVTVCYYSKFTVAVNIPRIAGQGPVLIGTRSRSVKRAAVLTLQTTQRKNRRASRYPYEDRTLPRYALRYRQPEQ